MVTHRVRVWIETSVVTSFIISHSVTLRVRVWIETSLMLIMIKIMCSHPPREGVD